MSGSFFAGFDAMDIDGDYQGTAQHPALFQPSPSINSFQPSMQQPSYNDMRSARREWLAQTACQDPASQYTGSSYCSQQPSFYSQPQYPPTPSASRPFDTDYPYARSNSFNNPRSSSFAHSPISPSFSPCQSPPRTLPRDIVGSINRPGDLDFSRMSSSHAGAYSSPSTSSIHSTPSSYRRFHSPSPSSSSSSLPSPPALSRASLSAIGEELCSSPTGQDQPANQGSVYERIRDGVLHMMSAKQREQDERNQCPADVLE